MYFRRVLSRSASTPLLLLCVACALCASCAASGTTEREAQPRLFEIAGVEIRNELQFRVTDARVLVPRTGEFVSCGTVFPGTACSAAFPQRDYRGDPLSVTWQERGEPQSVEDFVLEVPAGLDTARPVWLQVVIFSPGNAGARLLSEPQGPR